MEKTYKSVHGNGLPKIVKSEGKLADEEDEIPILQHSKLSGSVSIEQVQVPTSHLPSWVLKMRDKIASSRVAHADTEMRIERLNKDMDSLSAKLLIMRPIQSVPLDKIENLPPQAAVTKRGLESFAKEGVEPSEGTFHGARLNRYVDIPIALVKNDDDTFSITDGMHRAVQVFISGDKNILAFVDGGHGPTLKNIFDALKQEAMEKVSDVKSV